MSFFSRFLRSSVYRDIAYSNLDPQVMDNFIQDYLMYLSYPNDMTPKTVQKIIPRLQNEIHSLEDIAITYDIRIENLEKVVAAYTRLHGDLPQHVKDELITDLTAKL